MKTTTFSPAPVLLTSWVKLKRPPTTIGTFNLAIAGEYIDTFSSDLFHIIFYYHTNNLPAIFVSYFLHLHQFPHSLFMHNQKISPAVYDGSALISRAIQPEIPIQILASYSHRGLSQNLSMLGCKKVIIFTRYDIDIIKDRKSFIAWQLN